MLEQLLAIVSMLCLSSPKHLQIFSRKNFLDGKQPGGGWAARVVLEYLHPGYREGVFAGQVVHPLKQRCREEHLERQKRGRRKHQGESRWPFPFGVNREFANVLVKQMSDPEKTGLETERSK